MRLFESFKLFAKIAMPRRLQLIAFTFGDALDCPSNLQLRLLDPKLIAGIARSPRQDRRKPLESFFIEILEFPAIHRSLNVVQSGHCLALDSWAC